jgi:NADPH2:quinone reductase
VFTLLPLLSGEGRAHHGDILKEATRLAEAGKLRPRLDPRRFGLNSVAEAHAAVEDRSADGKIVIDIAG